jgi:hypothetical protein
MATLQDYAGTLQQAYFDLQHGRCAEAAERITAILSAVPEPPQWSSSSDPPSDLGAWHWVWMAHKALMGSKGLPDPEKALKTALELLGCLPNRT